MSDLALQKITEAEERLAMVESPIEAVQIADIAQAAVAYAKRSGAAIPVINRAVRIKLSAERKAGELLANMEKHKGGRPSGNRSHNATGLSSLGINKTQSSRWQQLAAIHEDEWLGAISVDSKELTSSALYKLAKKTSAKPVVNNAETKEGEFSDFAQIVDAGFKFGTVYADPPWRYDNQGTRASTDNHYSTMTVDELCAMPVRDVVSDKAHLHLWTTNAFLFETPKILEAWGFEYKSTFVWVKPQMGIGNYWRNSHELLITGVRGGLTALSKSERSWVECKRGKHSAKPDQVRDSIMRLSPGPYLELFGRRNVRDWVVFGNQIEREIV